MSKVEMARKIVDQNPSFDRKQLIGAFISQLNMTKAGATTYAYNLTKGQPKTVKMSAIVKQVNKKFRERTVTEISRAELSKQMKADRLEMMKEVSRKQKELEAESMKQDREEMQSEIDEYVKEAQAYVATLSTPTRKFIGMAE